MDIGRTAARVSSAGLAAVLLVAPLAGGGWRLEVLPLISGLAFVAFLATSIDTFSRARRPVVPPLAWALVVLAGWTILQAVPWPAGVVEALSPQVAEVRSFVVGSAAGPLSYEPGATWREAGKLLMYAMVVLTVANRRRSAAELSTITGPMVVAGLAVVGVALLHRILGIERLFGLIDTARASGDLWTTFVNPNHAAGFLNLSGFCAVSLAVDQRNRARRGGWLSAAAILFVVSIAMGSKGAWLSLLGAGALFVGFVYFARSSASVVLARVSLVSVVLGAAVVTVVAALGKGPWGLSEKADALRNAAALLNDHEWFGIGRGAFVSVYPRYQTSVLQLTFAFPENLLVQLTAEWGVLVGLIAFHGLVVLVALRWWSASRPAIAAALAGVTAVVVHNLVDFSLELAGVAIGVWALLAVTSPNVRVRNPSVVLTRRGRPAIVAAVLGFAVTVSAAWFFAFSAGDLDTDRKQLREWVAGPRRPDASAVDALWARHPASAVV
ncbi:MAG: hypothetical protein AAF449_20080, partial [Myxococcota bacterium]